MALTPVEIRHLKPSRRNPQGGRLSKEMLADLELPEPDLFLGIG